MKKRLLVLITVFSLYIIGFSIVEAEETKALASEFEFFNFVSVLEKLPVEERAAYVEKNFETVKANNTFPIISEKEVTFVYLGGPKTKIAYVIGDFTRWEENEIQMKKIEGTNIFTVKKELELIARTEYMFKRKGASQFDLDIFNKNTLIKGDGAKKSFLKMPKYVEGPEIKYYKEIEHGTIEQFELSCKSVLDNSEIKRKVQVFIPANYNPSNLYKVIYFFDGGHYLSNEAGSAENILNYMISKKEIEPFIGVFIDPVDRNAEFIYDYRDKFIDYFITELVPWVEGKYSVRKDLDGRIIAGISNGGFFVTDVLYKHSDKFNKALSGSRVDIPHDYGKSKDYSEFLKNMKFPVKLFMATGAYDTFLKDGTNYYEKLTSNPTVKAIKFITKFDGHNWSFWRDTLREGLLWLEGN